MRRCGDCKWWGWPLEWEENPDVDADVTRNCRLFSDYGYDENRYPRPVERYPEQLAFVCPWAGADGGSFSTSVNFGCSQWEGRDDRLSASDLRQSR